MKKILFTILIISLVSINAFAAFEKNMWSVRAASMGEAYIGLSDDQGAVFYNPAGLTRIDKYAGEFTYERLYGLDFINYFNGVLAYNFGKYGTLGIGFDHMAAEWDDTDLSSETRFTLAYGYTLRKDLHTELDMGIRLNAYSLEFGDGGSDMYHLEDFGSTTEFGIDIAFLGTLYNRTSIGFVLNNINYPSFGDGEIDEMPMSAVIGLAYKPYDRVTTSFDIEQRKEQTTFRSGVEYRIIDNLFLRTGIQMNPNLLTGGFAVKIKGFSFNYGVIKHPVLDLTHKFSLQFSR